MRKNALVLAGGNWQVPLINFLKEKGDRVIVVDPFKSSAGVKLADLHIPLDVKSTKEILNSISNLSIKIDYVISDQSDIAIKSLAEINEELNLIGIRPEVAKFFTNKYEMREYATANNIPVPIYKKCYNEKDLTLFFESNNKNPIILKPADSQSSRGIFKITSENITDISIYLKTCFQNTSLDYVICEQFIEGIEVTAEGFCSNKKHNTLALSKKKHFRVGIASDLIYPSDLPSNINERITKYNDHYVNNSNLQFGITHAEYIYNELDDKIYLIEIACRGGGTLISSNIIKWVSSIDVYELLYANLNNQITNIIKNSITQKSSILHFFEFPSGVVKKIEGIKEINELLGIVIFKLEFTVGDTIIDANDDRSRQGYVIINAENPYDLNKQLQKVNELLKVTIE